MPVIAGRDSTPKPRIDQLVVALAPRLPTPAPPQTARGLRLRSTPICALAAPGCGGAGDRVGGDGAVRHPRCSGWWRGARASAGAEDK